MAEAEQCPSPSPAPNPPTNQHPDLVYECCWDNCDWQFEDMQDCIEHAVSEGCGHVHMYFAAVPPHGMNIYWLIQLWPTQSLLNSPYKNNAQLIF